MIINLLVITCGDIAGREGTGNIHETNGHHFFVAINLVVVKGRESSSNSYSFLEAIKFWIL